MRTRLIVLGLVLYFATACGGMEGVRMTDAIEGGPAAGVEGRAVLEEGGNPVAVGYSVAAVKDAGGWRQVPIPPGDYMAAARNGSTVVAVGANGGKSSAPVAALSRDGGETWISVTMPPGAWRGVSYGLGRFVAVGSGCAASTVDGETWELRAIPLGTYRDVAFSPALAAFVAVGDSGKAARTLDGETWTAQITGAYLNLNAVRWSSSLARFVAVGSSYSAAFTADGAAWTRGEALPLGIFYGIACGPEACVAVGNGVAARSEDGRSWAATTIPPVTYPDATLPGLYLDVAATAEGFQAIGKDASAEAGADGSTWSGTGALPGAAGTIYTAALL